ncbi:hypothetical protein KCM76_19030 [Zooshikella marina]|uniref:hypothetical protein n=1 Tax=Zooshikella ganghwensis TaxID=202772 RepID=UPI001BAE6EDB|nr:hypothetical protein [Zooshikella ganghwensis]MBU2708096.1 hypothetical protein [Zooshikella ganghwensis]
MLKIKLIRLNKLKILYRFIVVASLFPVMVVADHNWNNYHWARMDNTVFRLEVINSTTAEWGSSYDQTLVKWSVAIPLDTVKKEDSNRVRKRCKMQAGQIRVCNAAYGFNGWLGLATIGIDANGHIDRGTAKVNDSYATYWTIPGEMNHVMCQEVGHLLGLGHTSEDGTSQKTCMDYSTDPDSQWPNAHDYEELSKLYGHLDAYNSYLDSGDDAGGEGVCNAPPGKGCNKNNIGSRAPMGFRVHKSAHQEIWVAPRKDGGLWIHHVRLVN